MNSHIHEEIIEKKLSELSLYLDCLKQIPIWYPPKIWRVISRSKSLSFELYDLIGHLGISNLSDKIDELEDILFSIISFIGIIGFGGVVWFLYQLLYDKILTFFTKKFTILGITLWQQQPFWLIGTIGAILVILVGYIVLSWVMKKFWIYRISNRLDKIKKQREKGKSLEI